MDRYNMHSPSLERQTNASSSSVDLDQGIIQKQKTLEQAKCWSNPEPERFPLPSGQSARTRGYCDSHVSSLLGAVESARCCMWPPSTVITVLARNNTANWHLVRILQRHAPLTYRLTDWQNPEMSFELEYVLAMERFVFATQTRVNCPRVFLIYSWAFVLSEIVTCNCLRSVYRYYRLR